MKNKLLLNLMILLLGLLSPFYASAGDISYKRDGFLRLYHSHLNDFLEIQYEKGGAVIPEAMAKINHLMRSRDSGEVREMDINLIRLIDHLQDHFGADTVEVICGYRSAEYNEDLKNAGRNVAENSNHIRGIAADIHLDEISEETIVKYARKLGFGGVGYYPNLMMVHVDLGWKHNWDEGKFANRTDIGIFNKGNSAAIRSNKVFYGEKDIIKLALKNIDFSHPGGGRGPGSTNLDTGLRRYDELDASLKIEVEHFYRGQWQAGKMVVVNSVGKNQMELAANLVPVGKNRLRFTWANGAYQNSNEFYLKRK